MPLPPCLQRRTRPFHQLLLFHDVVAIPATRLHSHIAMTLITELAFIGVALLQTRIGEALIEQGAVQSGYIRSALVADHLITPVVEKIHMFGAHVFRGFDALRRPVGRRFQVQLPIGIPRSLTVPEWNREQRQKDEHPDDDLPLIVHLFLPPFVRSSFQRLAANVRVPGLFPFHDESVGHHFMHTAHFHAGYPVLEDSGNVGLINGAHAGDDVHTMGLMDVFDRVGPGEPAAQAHLQILISPDAGAAAAAEGLLADRVFGHFVEVVADLLEDVSSRSPMALAGLHESWKVTTQWSLRLGSSLSLL